MEDRRIDVAAAKPQRPRQAPKPKAIDAKLPGRAELAPATAPTAANPLRTLNKVVKLLTLTGDRLLSNAGAGKNCALPTPQLPDKNRAPMLGNENSDRSFSYRNF